MAIQKLRVKSIFDNFGKLPPIKFGDVNSNIDPAYQDLFKNKPPKDSFDTLEFGVDEKEEPKSEDLTPSGKEPTDNWKTHWEQMKQLYTPESGATDRFDKLLSDFPEREEPSWQRKLTAGLMGLGDTQRNVPGGIDVMDKVLHGPYNRAAADWKEKSQPYYNAANLERQENINERTLASQFLQNETANRKIEETTRIADEKNRISKIRADAYALKQAGWTIKIAGDRIIGIDPVTHQQHDLGDSGGMDERDKIILQNEGKVEAAKQFGANQANVANIREGMYLRDSEGNIYYLPNDKSMTPIPVGNAPSTPRGMVTQIPSAPPGGGKATNEQDLRNQKFQKVADEHPELQEFLVRPRTANDDWQLGPPPPNRAFGRGPDPVKMAGWNKARQLLGFSAPESPASTNTRPPAQPPAQQQKPPVQQQTPPQQPQSSINPFDPFMQGTSPSEDPFAQPPIKPGQNLGNLSDIPGAYREAVRPKLAPSAPPQQVQAGLGPGEVMVRDKQTGKTFAMRTENVQRALQTGRYEVVK